MQNIFNLKTSNKNRISTPYEAMDLVDEAQMVNEIEGKVTGDEAMVYSFPDKGGGKEIAGLPLMRHKVGYQEKLTTTTNQASPSCPLPISKDIDPRLEADEINRLAKTWCELILGFIQERNMQTQIQGAIQE